MIVCAKESQNKIQFENYQKSPGLLGPYTTHIWNNDPRHLCFLLARYKFVAKMLSGKNSVLEIGVGDGFGVPIVAQTVKRIHAIDWEPLLMEDNRKRLSHIPVTFECLDITSSKPSGEFDAAYSLDVIEHIPNTRETAFFENIHNSLVKTGVFILGTPNITASIYASEASREGHINLKSYDDLRKIMGLFFDNVFMFSMNDEVLHTGYGDMSHYLLAMGVGPKNKIQGE
ncbi:MAG: class I SAM-dependent methyltransferase [Candidatus Ozemobacteraceae bacterium]